MSPKHAKTTSDEVHAPGVDAKALAGLRRWNIALTILHLAQAIAVLVLATDFAITVTTSFQQGPPGAPAPAPEAFFDVRIGWAIAAFLILAALDHGLTGTVMRGRYENGLRSGINRFRWVEYSFSATIMIVLIGFYNGLTGLAAVILIIGGNVAMILFGWIQELMNPPGRARTTMLPFWFGTLVGLAPWIVILVNLIGATQSTGGAIPGFVYGIVISLAVFFSSFGVNQWLQYRGIGPWKNYAYGEKVYLVLSLVAKSALAWQIFAGSLFV